MTENREGVKAHRSQEGKEDVSRASRQVGDPCTFVRTYLQARPHVRVVGHIADSGEQLEKRPWEWKATQQPPRPRAS